MSACACEERVRQLEEQLAATKQELAAATAGLASKDAHYQQLSAIVEGSRDAIWSWTLDGTINSWNAEAERLLQYNADEILGKSLLQLVAPERLERAREVIANLLDGGWYEQYDTVRVRKDGTRVPVELTVSPIRNAAGVVIGGASVCRDITVRKEQERALRESEERFSKLFYLSPVALSLSTLDEGRYLAVNSSLLAATGYAREEVIGHTARELKVYSDPADFRRIRQHLATSRSVRNLELGLRTKNGNTRFALFSAEVIDLDGKPCLLAAIVDITERKNAEDTLAASGARLRAVLETLYDGVAAVDTSGEVVFVNDAMARLLGFRSGSELPAMQIREALTRIEAFGEDGSPIEFAQRPLVRALTGETVIDLPLRMRQSVQSREYEVVNTAVPVRDASGRVTMAVVRMRDVTEQKRILRSLQLSQERYEMAMRAVDAMVYDWDVRGGRVERSAALERILGFRPDETEPTVEWWRSRIHPDDQSAAGSQVEAELGKGEERHIALYRIRHRDGHWVDVADRGIATYDEQGKPRRVVGSTVDVTPSKRAEEALRESEERYRSLVDNANDIVATLDLEGRFTSVNPAVERILGYSPQELVGRSLSAFIPPDEMSMHQAMLRQKMEGGSATRYEMRIVAKNSRYLTLEINSQLIRDTTGAPVGIHSIARDVSERKDSEARQVILLRELQHRTKNMLAVIQSIASQTLKRSRDLESAHEAFVGRLHALANAQEFIAAGVGGGVPLRDLVDAELAAFGARATIRGMPLVVGGSFAQTLALVIHELATNATKHGALSAESGRLDISWEAAHVDGATMLTFTWLEHDGPPVRPPQTAGFGTTILRMAGDATIECKEGGLEYRLVVPFAEIIRTFEAKLKP